MTFTLQFLVTLFGVHFTFANQHHPGSGGNDLLTSQYPELESLRQALVTPPKPSYVDLTYAKKNPNQYPDTFSFGVGSGAYQIEGAWNQDSKGESIWDRWLHTNPEVVIDETNGDVAADAYNKIEEDIALLANLTVSHYTFSISWARIIPSGSGSVNPLGIEHYKQLIKLLRINNIEPYVIIYQGDLPQVLQDRGGFLSPSFVDWYLEYARVLFDNFGQDVKYWITFNSPTKICEWGYSGERYPPGYTDVSRHNKYLCGHNLLKAHATVYHFYDKFYRCSQNGKLSIGLESSWYEPGSDFEIDLKASETILQFQIGWWANPLFNGDYPEIMKTRIAVKSKVEGLSKSRLPEFTPEEIAGIQNTIDFLSLTYLTQAYSYPLEETVYYFESWGDDVGAVVVTRNADDAPGIGKLLAWINWKYNNPDILISNGYGTGCGDLTDDNRIAYMKNVLTQIRFAMLEDEVNIFGYTYYSYIDGFEGIDGLNYKYGLLDVDFNSKSKPRRQRKSAEYYRSVCSTGCV